MTARKSTQAPSIVNVTSRGWELDLPGRPLSQFRLPNTPMFMSTSVRPGDIYGFRLVGSRDNRSRGNSSITLSVYELEKDGETLLIRDQSNLTLEKRRDEWATRFVSLGVPATAKHVLVIEEAMRQMPPPSSKNRRNGQSKVYVTPSSDFTGNVTKLSVLREIFERWLLLKDPDLLQVSLGAVAAHRLGGELVWLLLVAPPSGVKTEILRTLERVSGVYPISELTSHTFASGLDADEETSLLEKLGPNAVLLFKDFTTVLEMRYEERQAILAQLREIYDGRFDKVWGTGKELHWSGRLGFLAGVTEVIDQHHSVIALLGPRFVQLRISQPDRQAAAIRAIKNVVDRRQMQQELAAAVVDFLSGLGTQPPYVSDIFMAHIAKIADVVTRARSSVVRDSYKRELDYAPEPESPARFGRQLYALLQGVTLVNGRSESTFDDVVSVTRVARDCIPKLRTVTLTRLLDSPTDLATPKVASSVQYSTTTIRRTLEDLQCLALVTCASQGPGKPDIWGISNEYRKILMLLFATPQELAARLSPVCMCPNMGRARVAPDLPQCPNCEKKIWCPECGGCRECRVRKGEESDAL